tara:strand:- start:349 stop:1014 length:666 start_codon:yes stop_codon:yes gene_type:complete
MSSELKLTNLKHPSSGSNNLVLASDGNVSITNTLSAGTIGGNVVFPDGIITNTIARKYSFDTNTSYANATTDEKIFTRTSDTSTTVSSFTAKQGYTYIINMIYYGYTARESGDNSGREGALKMYYGTTARTQGNTTFDTKLSHSQFGRSMATPSNAGGSPSFVLVNMVGSFYHSGSDATVYYYGTSYSGSDDRTVVFYMSTDHAGYDVIYEIKGNKLTTET